jgi:hypothetical protein
MRRWLLLLGGLAVWAVHFLGVYVLASVADLRGPSEQEVWQAAHVVFSLACMVVCAALLVAAGRRMGNASPDTRFMSRISGAGAGLGLLAILWQSLPALI